MTNQCRQSPPLGLSIQGTQPLHHLMAQQNMALLDQLYGRIMQLQFNEKQFVTLLRELQSGSIELSQLKISDGGFEIMPMPPSKPTEMKEAVRIDEPKAGGANNKSGDREKAPAAG